VIGFFLNTLPLRLRPRGVLSFLELVRETREQVVAALADAELPFEFIVDAVRPVRDLSHAPLFQVLLTHDAELPEATRAVPGFTVEPLVSAGTTSQFDLSVHVRARGGRTDLTLEYCTALFSRDTIADLGRTIVAAAECLRRHPATPLAQLSFLAPGRSERLLAAWNEPPRDGVAARQVPAIDRRSVVERIDAVAAACPDRVAVEVRGTSPDARLRPAHAVSYGALRQRAAEVAGSLGDHELPPEALVAVALDREADFVSACLAVWQLGYAVLPLDPRHPPARLDAILQDSKAALLLHAGLLSPDGHSARDSGGFLRAIPAIDLRTVVRGAPRYPVRTLLPESLAYVLYTSGSTGRPKGVQISHGALASFLGAVEARLLLSPGDELLAVTTFMFDIAFLEVLLPLVRGAKTVLLEHDSTVDPRRLAAAIEGGGTRLVQATPSHWRMLVDSGWRGSADLVIACGGERLDTDLSAALVARSGELWNLYGPTEATIWSSIYRILAPGRGASEPIGTPLANTRLYVLDGRLEPAPHGAAGELYIGGDALARGYRGQTALTAQCFIPDPWSSVPGARMYRTGDIVAFSPAAGIRFLRRGDDQVKVRGHRIELAEIEQVARQHPAVADAIAVVQETGRASGASLALHVLLRDAVPAQEDESGAIATVLRGVREHLRRALPDYMVPPLLSHLDAVPLTPNGKKDRARLTPIEFADDGPVVAPPIQEPLALELRAIWGEVLGEASADADAGFFELGGNSLAAARLIHLIEARLSMRLPVAALFEHSTQRALLSILRDRGTSVHAPALVTLRKGSGPPIFAFPGAGGNSVYFHAMASALPTPHPVFGLQAVGLDGDRAPHESVADIAAHAVEQLRRVQPAGPYLLLGHSLGGRVAFEVARSLESAGDRVALLGVLDTPAPLHGTAAASASARDLADDLAWLDDVKEIVEVTTGQALKIDAQALRALSNDARIAIVASRLTETGLLLDGRLARGFISVYQAAARTSYEASEPIAAPIALLRVERANEPDEGASLRGAWGWDKLTTGGAASVVVPGGHISMLMPPHVETLAARLGDILGAVTAGVENWPSVVGAGSKGAPAIV
jgi:amino acid adenylation domain-containing protein